MPLKPIPPRVFLLLSVVGLLLMITEGVVLAVAAILVAMGDETGGQVFRWAGLALAIPLAVDLVCLLLALGFKAAELDDIEPPDLGQE